MKTSKALEVVPFLSDFFLIHLVLRVHENEGTHIAFGRGNVREWWSLIRAIGPGERTGFWCGSLVAGSDWQKSQVTNETIVFRVELRVIRLNTKGT